MKKRKSFLIIVAILVLGLAGWWFWDLKSFKTETTRLALRPVVTTQNSTAKLSAIVTDALYAPSQIKAGNAINAMLMRNPGATIPLAQLVAAGVSKEQITKSIQDAQNAQSIDVYGKVVDQYGGPVSNVKVHGGVLLNVGIEGSGGKNYETETDAQGLFNFKDLHGVRFGATFEKSGYEYNPKLYLTWWDTYKPDPSKPMVFVMYKLQGGEPMVHSKIHDYIPCDGTEILYDLSTGKRVTSGGGLIVSFTRNPVDIHRGKPFEWTLTLTVPSGGLTEIRDLYPYEAPESGYQETITITTGSAPKTYTDSTNKTYYYKSSEGKYGRINIELQADFQPPPTSFDGSIYLNPSGSRNLEWYPDKEINPQ